MPSKPKSFPVSREVLTSRSLILTSAVCLIASIGGVRIARRAGIHAEIRVVTRHIAAAIKRATGFITRRISTFAAEVKALNASRKRYSVIPMPAQPTMSPLGIAAALSTSASQSTERRICFFVAPTDFSMPNSRVLSATEMENELYMSDIEPNIISPTSIAAKPNRNERRLLLPAAP